MALLNSGHRGNHTPHVPEEIWALIVSHTDHDVQKHLRLTCRMLSRVATVHYFREIKLRFQIESLENLIKIAHDERYSRFVRTLRLAPSPGLRQFKDFEDWKSHLSEETLSQIENGARPPATELSSISNSTSTALSVNTDEYLRSRYARYEAERIATTAENFVSYFRWRTRATREPGAYIRQPSDFKGNLMRFVGENFDDTLAMLPNLRSLVSARGSVYDMSTKSTWRGLSFSLPVYRVHDMQPRREAERRLLLPLALRALGWRNFFNNSLKSMELVLSPGLLWRPRSWSNEQFWYMWSGDSEEDLDSLPEDKHLMQLQLTQDAFVHLESLDLTLPVNLLDTGRDVEMVAECLAKARDIKYFRFCSSRSEPGLQNDLLALLHDVHWPKIQELDLEDSNMSEEAVAKILTNAAPTLRKLSLGTCHMGSTSSWPGVFERMRTTTFPLLDELSITYLCDIVQPGKDGRTDDVRTIYDAHVAGTACFKQRLRNICDYALGRTDTAPAWDEKEFGRVHVKTCVECAVDPRVQFYLGLQSYVESG